MNEIEKVGLVAFLVGLVMWLHPNHSEWAVLLTGIRIIGGLAFIFGHLTQRAAGASPSADQKDADSGSRR